MSPMFFIVPLNGRHFGGSNEEPARRQPKAKPFAPIEGLQTALSVRERVPPRFHTSQWAIWKSHHVSRPATVCVACMDPGRMNLGAQGAVEDYVSETSFRRTP